VARPAWPTRPPSEERHSVETLGRLLREIAGKTDDASIVERHVQPTIGSDRALDHGSGLRLLGHIARDADRLAAGGGQRSGRGVEGIGVDVSEHDSGARLANACAAASPMPELAPVTRAT
jgi:hypothetical protein